MYLCYACAPSMAEDNELLGAAVHVRIYEVMQSWAIADMLGLGVYHSSVTVYDKGELYSKRILLRSKPQFGRSHYLYAHRLSARNRRTIHIQVRMSDQGNRFDGLYSVWDRRRGPTRPWDGPGVHKLNLRHNSQVYLF